MANIKGRYRIGEIIRLDKSMEGPGKGLIEGEPSLCKWIGELKESLLIPGNQEDVWRSIRDL